MVDAVEVLPLLREKYLRMLHNYVGNDGFIVRIGSADQQSDQDYIYFFPTMSSSPDFLVKVHIRAALVLVCL